MFHWPSPTLGVIMGFGVPAQAWLNAAVGTFYGIHLWSFESQAKRFWVGVGIKQNSPRIGTVSMAFCEEGWLMDGRCERTQ